MRGFTEPDESEIPDEAEIEAVEDPLAGVPIGVQKRKMALWKAAASTIDAQNHPDAEAVAAETRRIAAAMDMECVDWLANGGDDR